MPCNAKIASPMFMSLPFRCFMLPSTFSLFHFAWFYGPRSWLFLHPDEKRSNAEGEGGRLKNLTQRLVSGWEQADSSLQSVNQVVFRLFSHKDGATELSTPLHLPYFAQSTALKTSAFCLSVHTLEGQPKSVCYLKRHKQPIQCCNLFPAHARKQHLQYFFTRVSLAWLLNP